MKTKFICGFFPKYKLHKVCRKDMLRPVMNYLYFKDGNVYATDAHIAIAAPLSFVSTFSDEEQKLLDGKLIHAKQFAELLKMRETKIERVSEDLTNFVCKTIYGQIVMFPLLNEKDQNIKFSNVKVVVENAIISAKNDKNPISRVGINANMLANLADAIGTKNIDLYFTNSKSSIVVLDNDECNEIRAIIMPIIINSKLY